MAELDGSEVLSGISMRISTGVPSTDIAAIYKDTPAQNAITPYAFLHLLNNEFSNEMRNRGQMDFLVDVRVHPKKDQVDVHTWGQKIGVKLQNVLNTIQISGKPVKSRSMSWSVKDGVLHFIVGYQIKVVEVTIAGDAMATATYGTKIL
jgi:hypothetical protein